METKETAKLIKAISNLLIANKQVGTYKKLEALCIDKLEKLISSINI